MAKDIQNPKISIIAALIGAIAVIIGAIIQSGIFKDSSTSDMTSVSIAQKTYTLGLSGGTGGKEFKDAAIPKNSKAVTIKIWSGRVVYAIQIVYETSQGYRHETPKHGGNGGSLNVFSLGEGEYITGISGKYGSLVDSIRIHTNKQISQLYGGSGGSSDYSYLVPNRIEIIGFYGRAGDKIDAIGVTTREF